MRSVTLLACLLCFQPLSAAEPAAKLVGRVKAIGHKGAHNAFTDLIRFHKHWYCTYREGPGHAAGAGTIRVLFSKDGGQWTSAALLESTDVDLRDPKLSITPDGRLMMVGGAATPASRKPIKDH